MQPWLSLLLYCTAPVSGHRPPVTFFASICPFQNERVIEWPYWAPSPSQGQATTTGDKEEVEFTPGRPKDLGGKTSEIPAKFGPAPVVAPPVPTHHC